MLKVLIICLILLIIYIYFGRNKEVIVREDELSSSKIKKSITIAIISDLHNYMFGNNYDVIINIIKDNNIDFIIMPGDILDNNERINNSYKLLESLKTYKIFYTLGNHEYRIATLNEEINKVKELGISLLRNEKEDYLDDIRIIGIEDVWHDIDDESKAAKLVNNLVDESKYNILISHRPNYIELYDQSNVDLVICGHTHGGQWRIPFINKPIYGPDQGLFPKYATGIHKRDKKLIYISNGLATGRRYLPRLYNPSEVGIIRINKS